MIREISVAVADDYPPYYFRDQEGNAAGWTVDIWRLWSQKTGIRVNFASIPWNDTLQMVKEGKIDAHGGLFYSQERATYLDYVAPLLVDDTCIFFHKNIYGIETLNDLLGYRIGTVKGDFAEGYLRENLPEASIVTYPGNHDLFSALKDDQIRVFIAGVPTGIHFLKEFQMESAFNFYAIQPLYSSTFYSAVKKGNALLHKIIEEGMQTIAPEDRLEIDRRWGAIPARSEDELYIAFDRNNPPFTMLTHSGRPAGLLYDLWRLWAQKMNRDIEFVFTDGEGAIASVKDGRADIHAGLFGDEYVEAGLAVSNSIFTVQSELAFKTTQTPLSLDQLADAKVGVIAGSEEERELRAFYTEIIPSIFDNSRDLLAALHRGEVIAAYSSGPLLQYAIDNRGLADEIKVSDLVGPNYAVRAAVSLGGSNLLDDINRGLFDISHSELRSIELRWQSDPDLRLYSATSGPMTLTRQEKKWLEEHPHIRLGVDPDFMPFEFLDSEGVYRGAASSYVSILSEKLGVTMVPLKGLTWHQVIDAAKSGEVDVLPCLSRTPERMEFLHFTRPYLTFQTVIVTRSEAPFLSGLDELKGSTVAVVRGYSYTEIMKTDYPDILFFPVADIAEGLKAVDRGRVSAFVGNAAVINYYINRLNLKDLKTSATTDYESSFHFGVRKDWPELVSILDKTLRSIPMDKRQAIANQWINVRVERLVDWSAFFKAGSVILLFVFCILASIVYWNRKLARESIERKAAEMKLRAMSDASHDAVIMINGLGEVQFWNTAAERMFGIPAEQALNSSMHNIFVPEELRDAARKGLEHFARTGQGPVIGSVLEHEALNQDGNRFPVEIAVTSFQLEKEWYAVGSVRDISSRKQAEKAIAESQHKMRTLIDNIPAVVLMKDTHGRYMMANAMFSQVTGVGYHEVIGKTDHDIFPPDVAHGIVDMDRKTLNTGELLKFEEEVPHQDGSIRTYETINAPLFDDEGKVSGMVGISSDITERKAAEQELLESRQKIELASKRFETLFEMSPIGMALVDHATGEFIEVNKSVLESTGYTKEEFISLDYWQLTPKEYEAQEMQQIEDLNTKGRFGPNEKEYIRKDGSRYPLRIQGFILTDVQGRKVVWGILEDISELKKKEKEVEKWTHQLSESNQRMRENLEELERFARLTVNREKRMIQLKEEINALLEKAGMEKKYKIVS